MTLRETLRGIGRRFVEFNRAQQELWRQYARDCLIPVADGRSEHGQHTHR